MLRCQSTRSKEEQPPLYSTSRTSLYTTIWSDPGTYNSQVHKFSGKCSIKSNERNEYSYLGLGDIFLFFFQEKVLKSVHAQI